MPDHTGTAIDFPARVNGRSASRSNEMIASVRLCTHRYLDRKSLQAILSWRKITTQKKNKVTEAPTPFVVSWSPLTPNKKTQRSRIFSKVYHFEDIFH
jgi:hypothetical protein